MVKKESNDLVNTPCITSFRLCKYAGVLLSFGLSSLQEKLMHSLCLSHVHVDHGFWIVCSHYPSDLFTVKLHTLDECSYTV